MAKAEFTVKFVTPLIDLTLRPCKSHFIFKTGDQTLILLKGYENIMILKEDDNRLIGLNSYDIIKMLHLMLYFYP
jgi:hypothetical protein